MSIRGAPKIKQMRQLIAMEAARLIAEHGIRDYYAAKRKAAAQLGARETQNMPSNQEIEQALGDYQRLFKADSQPQRLKQLREAAVQAMRLFIHFNARLVGSVLSGTTVHDYSDVDLHLFADTPEEVGLFLMQKNIPFETVERRLRVTNEFPAVAYPGYSFIAGEIMISLTVFPQEGIRQVPRSPIDGRPMRRASIPVVLKLLEETS